MEGKQNGDPLSKMLYSHAPCGLRGVDLQNVAVRFLAARKKRATNEDQKTVKMNGNSCLFLCLYFTSTATAWMLAIASFIGALA